MSAELLTDDDSLQEQVSAQLTADMLAEIERMMFDIPALSCSGRKTFKKIHVA